MPTETDHLVDEGHAIVTRQREVRATPTRSRPNARGGAVRRRFRAAMIAIGAILLAMFAIGLFVPIGTTGVMIAALAIFAALALVFMLPAERVADAAALPKTPIAALPLRTEGWLAAQRRMLPAPAQTLADGIGVKLEALSPQLATLDDREPAAAEIRRLLADELPGLVNGYAKVPPAMRAKGIDGLAPDTQLVDGLKLVDTELDRMSEQLARGDVEALATQAKYIEYKYRGSDA